MCVSRRHSTDYIKLSLVASRFCDDHGVAERVKFGICVISPIGVGLPKKNCRISPFFIRILLDRA